MKNKEKNIIWQPLARWCPVQGPFFESQIFYLCLSHSPINSILDENINTLQDTDSCALSNMMFYNFLICMFKYYENQRQIEIKIASLMI